MAGYLAVTDDMALTPAGVGVIGKNFRSRTQGLPSYAGTAARLHTWEAPFYNSNAHTVATLRGGIAAAQYAGDDYHLVMIGDSKTEGSGVGNAEADSFAYPAIVRRMLGGVEGVLPVYATGNVWDDRWATVGLKRSDPDYGLMGVIPDGSGGPYQLTFTSDFAHTGGTFWVYASAGATVTVSVDGGAGQPIAVASGNGFHAVTPTVTGNTAHTYTLNTPNPVHIATFVPTYDGPRLKVSRMGRGGSKAVDWAPGFNTSGVGLWDAFQTVTADAVVCGIGTNGIAQGQGNVDAIGVVYSSLAALKIPVVVIAPGGLGGTGAPISMAEYGTMYAAQWAAADTYDFPLIDFENIVGDYPTANAAGLMGDNLHENRFGYAYEAAAVKALIT